MTHDESTAAPALETSSIEQALALVADALSRALRALDDDVRGYPSPIARCDVQLPALIETRDLARQRLRSLQGLREARDVAAASGSDSWIERVQRWRDDLRGNTGDTIPAAALADLDRALENG